jgi:hypothetical protein
MGYVSGANLGRQVSHTESKHDPQRPLPGWAAAFAVEVDWLENGYQVTVTSFEQVLVPAHTW